MSPNKGSDGENSSGNGNPDGEESAAEAMREDALRWIEESRRAHETPPFVAYVCALAAAQDWLYEPLLKGKGRHRFLGGPSLEQRFKAFAKTYTSGEVEPDPWTAAVAKLFVEQVWGMPNIHQENADEGFEGIKDLRKAWDESYARLPTRRRPPG